LEGKRMQYETCKYGINSSYYTRVTTERGRERREKEKVSVVLDIGT